MLVDTTKIRYLPDSEVKILNKLNCHLGKPCSYISFSGVFKPIFGNLSENLTIDEVRKILNEKLKSDEVNGLIALAFDNKEDFGGVGIMSLNKNLVLSLFHKFPYDIKCCDRAKYVLNKANEFQDSLNFRPIYLITDMNVGCCEKNARKNGTLYEF